MFVDADAHVCENNETWSYFPKSMADIRPVEVYFDPDNEPPYLGRRKSDESRPLSAIYIDGHVHQRHNRGDARTQTIAETRELRDVPARIKDMDNLGVGTQILFPSTFLLELTQRPELEVALCESYNRWLADRCADSDGRLRFNAILPLRSIPDALREMRRAKEDGAVGIFKRPVDTDERSAGAEYFHPVYELAQELDLPIAMHTSYPYCGFTSGSSKLEPHQVGLSYMVDAFVSIMSYKIPQKFSRLRIGFIEAGSGWVPHVLWLCTYTDVERKYEWRIDDKSKLRDGLETMLEEHRLFVTCESIENLPFITDQIGDTNLMVGTDYSHADRSSILKAHTEVVEDCGLDKEVSKRLTEENATRFYALS